MNSWPDKFARWPTILIASSLLAVVCYALLFFTSLLFAGKIPAAFDLCYFRMDAYRELKPAELQRSSNDLLSDPVLMIQPWDRLMSEGRIPFPWLWNPYAGCGAPLLANGQSSPFFPLKWLAVLMGGKWAFGILCFLKILLAGLLTWSFLRILGIGLLGRTFGACCFMGCGFMIAWLQFPIASTAMWLPLLLIGCEFLMRNRPLTAFLALAGGSALSGLAGHPETTFHSLAIAGLYLLIRMLNTRRSAAERSACRQGLRLFAWFAGAGLVGLMIAAIQIIPTAEYILNSADFAQRQGSAQSWIADHWFFTNAEYARREWLSYILPDTWGNPGRHAHWWNPLSNYCESAGYVSAGALLLAIMAWMYFRKDPLIRAFCCLQAFSLLFILQITPLHINFQALPIFNIVANKRLIFVFCFANAALAALLVDRLKRDAVVPRSLFVLPVIIAALFFAFAGADYVQRFAANPYPWIRVYGNHQLEHLAWALLPWLALGTWPLLKPAFRPVLLASLILISAADLFLVHHRFNPFMKPDRIYPETPAITFLRSQTEPARVLPLQIQIGPNLPALYGLEDPRIYDALTSSWYREFLDAIGAKPRWNIVSDISLQFANLASIRYFWTSPGDAAAATLGLPLAYSDTVTRIYLNTNALPRAYVAAHWQSVRSPREALEIMRSGSEAPSGKPPDIVAEPSDVSAEAIRAKAEAKNAILSSITASTTEDNPCGKPPGFLAKEGDPRLMPVCVEGMAGTDGTTFGIKPARIVSHRPHHVRVELPAGSQGILVLNDQYDPGWTARSAGGAKPLYRVNGMFRGVPVTPYDRWVEFRYRPFSFALGAALSLLGLGLLGLVLVVRIRARISHRRKSPVRNPC